MSLISPKSCFALLLLLSGSAALDAQNISYNSGFNSSELAIVGSAKLNGSSLQLTDGGGFEVGGAMYATPVNVQGFTNDFTFRLSNPGADGFTFVVQNAGATALGAVGGGLGYQGLPKSVGIKFDLYNNSGEGVNSTGLYQYGAFPGGSAVDLTNSGINLHSGDLFQVHMVYDGATLIVSIADTNTGAVTTQSYSVNIPAAVGGSTAYVGFTGGTGGLTATQNILNWTYASTTPGASACASPMGPVYTGGNGNVVGNGSPASCTEGALNNALAAGGTVTFNCGPTPVRIPLSSTKSISRNTVIDGGNLVTLDGGGRVRQLLINTHNYEATSPTVTVQNVTFANGYANDNGGTGSPTGGGAILRYGGTLNVINSRFINNVGPNGGQDSAGGAIYSVGVGTTTVVGSVFEGNRASNGGAIGHLGGTLVAVNDTMQGNQATGTGGNPGNGGNGGGIYIDGVHVGVQMCGTHTDRNHANAYGGGFFFVEDASGGKTAIDRSTFNGNAGAFAGGMYLQSANGYFTNSSITGNSVQGIAGVGPYAPGNFFYLDSIGNLGSDTIQ